MPSAWPYRWGPALSALYIWKRNLVFATLVHLVIDAPLIVLALIG